MAVHAAYWPADFIDYSGERSAMFGPSLDPNSLDGITHIIQVALTPVFLLSAIAGLLNVFSTRLGRVADRVDLLADKLESADPLEAAFLSTQLSSLQRRSLALDVAVVLGTLGGGATCVSAFALFLGALRNSTAANILLGLFGFALVCTIAALVAFTCEMMMASWTLREKAQREQKGTAPS